MCKILSPYTLLSFQRLTPRVLNFRQMCILFIHNASKDPKSEYRLIIASNRDEFYDRPALPLRHWEDDNMVVGGKDLEAGGTWLAVCPRRGKMGVLLNLPTKNHPEAKTRGKIVADFVKSNTPVEPYIESIKTYGKECNHFIFVAVDLGKDPVIYTYTNLTDSTAAWEERNFGVSNSPPEKPLKKVQAGKIQLNDICNKYRKISEKRELIKELLELLKSSEKHLPDAVLETRGGDYQHYSSIRVHIPHRRYGTRTHTLILITKNGHMDVIESTLQAPVDLDHPSWLTTEMQFEVPL